MKAAKIQTFLLLTALPILLSGCAGIGSMYRQYEALEVSAEPEVLEVHCDSIPYTITGQIPEGYFNKRATLRLEPTLRFADQDLPLDPLYLVGERAEREGGAETEVIEKQEGGNFSITGKVPYRPGMQEAYLIMVPTLQVSNPKYDDLDQCISPPEDTLALGVITTSVTVMPTDEVIFGGGADGRGGDGKGGIAGGGAGEPSSRATLYYQINRSVIRDTTLNKPEVQRLLNFIQDTTNVVNQISITSYASPEGEIDFNDRLAAERTNSAYNWLVRKLRQYGIDRYNDSAFVRQTSIKEDWQGFRQMVQRSDFENKAEVLAIINSEELSLVEKEAAIKEMEGTFAYLLDNIFPPLRRSVVEVHAYGSVRDVPTVMAEGKKSLDNLNRLEMLVYAYNLEDTAAKAEVYSEYMAKYPQDWKGPNNYAIIQMWQGEYEAANELLENLNQKYPTNDTIKYNLAVSHRLTGDYQRAEELLLGAQEAGLDADHNLGLVSLNTCRYAEAVEYFEADRCGYNVALAYTLQGNYDQALSRIDCVAEKDADDFYLRGVIAARKGDLSLLTTSLTRAIQMNPALRERAKKDLEFRAYRNNPQFTNALR